MHGSDSAIAVANALCPSVSQALKFVLAFTTWRHAS